MNNAPKIRFKGFTDAWVQRKLGEVAKKVTEKNKNNEFNETLTNSAEYGIINQRDFFDKDISNQKNLDGYYVVCPDDFVYNPRVSNFAPVGSIKRNLLGRTGVMSPLYYVFRFTKGNCTFWEKYFASNYWHSFIQINGDNGARSDRFNIRDSVFEEMILPYPTLPEQTAIGSFFRTLDDTITLHKRKLDGLKELKKGYLQVMFPQNGETVPRVRFKGFEGEWESRKLASFGKATGGTSIESEFNEKGKYKVINIGSYSEESRYTDQGIRVEANPKTMPRILNKDDLTMILNDKTSTGRIIGRVLLIDESDAFVYNQRTQRIEIDKMNYDAQFIYQLLNADSIREKIVRSAQGNTQIYVNWSAICELAYCVPLSINEQIQIGNFFHNLDEQIATQATKLEQLRRLKAAYLQKMFI